MKCDICKKKIATFHFKEEINNNVKEIHLCEKCAKEKGFVTTKEVYSSLADFIAGLTDLDIPFLTKETMILKCEICGLSFEEFKKQGTFGCSNCYKVFGQRIEPLLKRIHGSTQHLGKFPSEYGEKVKVDNEITVLKNQILELIKKEDFEQAAQIRDKIKELEKNKGD